MAIATGGVGGLAVEAASAGGVVVASVDVDGAGDEATCAGGRVIVRLGAGVMPAA
jgi:hypothetical protein